jgi:hypothetical protein
MKITHKNTTKAFNARYIIIISVIVAMMFAVQTNAATYTVDNNSDDATLTACTASPNDCSLRGAITNANYSPSDSLETDLIEFNAAMTITLGGTNLTVSGNRPVTINGQNRVTVSGNNLSNIFDVTKDVNLSITGLTITNGYRCEAYSCDSGGINNYGGTITLTNSTVTGNSGGKGGGISNLHGSLSIINSNISRNRAIHGSGISNEAVLTITDSTISNNSSLNYYSGYGTGGGIYNNGGIVNIYGSTIARNILVGGGKGGGLLNENGTISLTNSTVSGNQARQLQASGPGGGIYNYGTLILTNTTVYGNSGFVNNIFNKDSISEKEGLVIMRNSIVANTEAYSDCGIFLGFVISQGNNVTNELCQTTVTGDLTGNVVTNDPKIAPLGFYGGKTETHALLSDSPALNPASSNNAPAFDQRGGSRNGTADIGAFEMNSGDVVAELPIGKVNSAYSQTVVLYSVITNYCISAGTLPPGLSGIADCSTLTKPRFNNLSAVEPTLQLSGMPTIPGTYNFTIKASLGVGFSETNYKMVVLPVKRYKRY